MQTTKMFGADIFMKRTPSPTKSLYLRVREQILHDLITRNAKSGDRYYTENQLAKQLNVSRNTIRKAMGDLEQEGYLSRHRKIGTIIGKKTARPFHSVAKPGPTETKTVEHRQRVIVVLPKWNDSVEGFYTGKLLRALSSPELSPPFTIEIRHYNDPVNLAQPTDAAMVVVDPDTKNFSNLQEMADQGTHIIAIEPQQPIPGLINLFTDRRSIVCQIVKKFYEMGHKTVGLMNHNLYHMDYERSLMGYLDAHRELKIPIPHQGIVQSVFYNSIEIASVENVPDVANISAWVCAYMGSINIIARECRRAGLDIPGDVSLVSLDDPGDFPFAPIGKKISVVASDSLAAASLIHTYLNDWREDRRGTLIFIPSEWKNRETVAPPRPA